MYVIVGGFELVVMGMALVAGVYGACFLVGWAIGWVWFKIRGEL